MAVSLETIVTNGVSDSSSYTGGMASGLGSMTSFPCIYPDYISKVWN